MKEMETDLAGEVLQVELEWVQALRSLDLGAIERILADEYTQIGSGGRVTSKQEFLASLTGEERQWEIAESRDHDIRIYGETAVMIATWRGKGENHGEKFDYSARFLAVYVKKGDAWLLVADQSTPIRLESEYADEEPQQD